MTRHRFSTRNRVSISFKADPGRTKQSHREECDINTIITRFRKKGVIDHYAKHSGSYGYADSITYQEAMNIVAKAHEMFDDLPSEVRSRFANNPAGFLDWVAAPESRAELVKLGLANPDAPAVAATPPVAQALKA